MDPLTITTGSLTLAKVAFNLAGALNSGVQAVNGADATVKAFQGEITTLGNALNLVGRMFENPKLKGIDKQSLTSDGYVYDASQTLRTSLADCKDTLSQLDSIIRSASSTSKSSIFRRTVTAVKLDLKSAQITAIRNQIQTDSIAMQSAFSVLNVSILLTITSSYGDNNGYLTDIDFLNKRSEALSDRIREVDINQVSSIDPAKLSNLKKHLRVSQSILSHSATVTGTETGSVAVNSNLESSMTSVTPSNAGKHSEIVAWVREGLGDASRSSFGVTIAGKRFALALQKMEAKDYVEAEKMLDTTISSTNLQAGPLHEARLALILCYREQQKFEAAEKAILRLLDKSAGLSEAHVAQLENWLDEVHIQRIKVDLAAGLAANNTKKRDTALDCMENLQKSRNIPQAQLAHLSYSVAEIYRKQQKPKEALKYALQACETRHDRQDHLYYDSCRQLGRLYRSLGDPTEAALYYDEVPKEYSLGGEAKLDLHEFIDVRQDEKYLTMASIIVRIFSGCKYLLAGISPGRSNTVIFASGAVSSQKIAWKPIGSHRADIEKLVLSPNGRWLVSASHGEVKIWNLALNMPSLEKRISTNEFSAVELAISPDSKILFIANLKGGWYHWDFTKRKGHFSDIATTGISSLLFSGNGSLLAYYEGSISVSTIVSCPSLKKLTTKPNVRYVASSGSTFISTTDKVLAFWDSEGVCQRSIEREQFRYLNIQNVVCNLDGTLAGFSSSLGGIVLLDTATRKDFIIDRNDTLVEQDGLSFSSDGQYLASIHTSGTIKFWRIDWV